MLLASGIRLGSYEIAYSSNLSGRQEVYSGPTRGGVGASRGSYDRV